jgi:hypothetical protein
MIDPPPPTLAVPPRRARRHRWIAPLAAFAPPCPPSLPGRRATTERGRSKSRSCHCGIRGRGGSGRRSAHSALCRAKTRRSERVTPPRRRHRSMPGHRSAPHRSSRLRRPPRLPTPSIRCAMSRMNLRHMEVFRAVMEAGTVTGVARRVNVSQPAVTDLLRHTEDGLAFKLFERIRGRLRRVDWSRGRRAHCRSRRIPRLTSRDDHGRRHHDRPAVRRRAGQRQPGGCPRGGRCRPHRWIAR